MQNKIEQAVRGYLDRAKAKRDKDRNWQLLDAHFMSQEKYVLLIGQVKRVASYQELIDVLGKFWQVNGNEFCDHKNGSKYGLAELLIWLRERTRGVGNYEADRFWFTNTSGLNFTPKFCVDFFETLRQIYEFKESKQISWTFFFSRDLGSILIKVKEWMDPDLYNQMQVPVQRILNDFIVQLKLASAPTPNEDRYADLAQIARQKLPGGGKIRTGIQHQVQTDEEQFESD